MITSIIPHSLQIEDDFGETPEGVVGASFLNVGQSPAVVNGQPLPPQGFAHFGGRSVYYRLRSIPYDATGTTLRVDYETVDE